MSNARVCESMFYKCFKFKSDLSGWDMSLCKQFDNMFYDCHCFDCDISGWTVDRGVSFDNMLKNCGIDQALKDWIINTWLENYPMMKYNHLENI